MQDDAALFEAWRAGDRSVGEELFDRHFRAVVRFFRNKAGPQIDDLVQATFLACLEAGDHYRGDGSFRAFLFGVAHNILRDHYRRRRRDDAIVWATVSLRDLGLGPSQIVAGRAEQRCLLEALRTVPLESQVLLELYYWESMTAPQLATILGIPEGTVRTRIRRAKALVLEQIQSLSAGHLVTTQTNLDRWASDLRELIDRGE